MLNDGDRALRLKGPKYWLYKIAAALKTRILTTDVRFLFLVQQADFRGP